MSIVPATSDDVETVACILAEAVTWMQTQGTSLWSLEEVSSDAIATDLAAGHYYLLLVDQTPAATFRISPTDETYWSTHQHDAALYIHRLAVRSTYRGRGLLTCIFNHAANLALAQGIDRLRLDCDRSRTKLRALYEGAGFKFHSNMQLGSYAGARFEKML